MAKKNETLNYDELNNSQKMLGFLFDKYGDQHTVDVLATDATTARNELITQSADIIEKEAYIDDMYDHIDKDKKKYGEYYTSSVDNNKLVNDVKENAEAYYENHFMDNVFSSDLGLLDGTGQIPYTTSERQVEGSYNPVLNAATFETVRHVDITKLAGNPDVYDNFVAYHMALGPFTPDSLPESFCDGDPVKRQEWCDMANDATHEYMNMLTDEEKDGIYKNAVEPYYGEYMSKLDRAEEYTGVKIDVKYKPVAKFFDADVNAPGEIRDVTKFGSSQAQWAAGKQAAEAARAKEMQEASRQAAAVETNVDTPSPTGVKTYGSNQAQQAAGAQAAAAAYAKQMQIVNQTVASQQKVEASKKANVDVPAPEDVGRNTGSGAKINICEHIKQLNKDGKSEEAAALAACLTAGTFKQGEVLNYDVEGLDKFAVNGWAARGQLYDELGFTDKDKDIIKSYVNDQYSNDTERSKSAISKTAAARDTFVQQYKGDKEAEVEM